MTSFNGFPARMEFTPIPNHFFSALLPGIDDIVELKVTLLAIAALYRKKGYPKFTTCSELLENASLVNSLSEPVTENLSRALRAASERGTFLCVEVERGGEPLDIYLLNTRANQDVALRITSGDLELGGLTVCRQPPVKAAPQPDIFTLYEQNIGLLTPLVADELRDAEKSYPGDWVREAFKEAVNQNKRKWSYISAILERWASEGKTHGAYQRNTKAGTGGRLRTGYRHTL